MQTNGVIYVATELICKPNSVRVARLPKPATRRRGVTIHLGDALLRRSCDLPGNAPRCAESQIRALRFSATWTESDQLKTPPYLVLHRRGFA